MGEAKRSRAAKEAWKAKFIATHPRCCFCAGAAPAEEPDHVPARAIFDDRQWPEGYVFPACHRCNQATKADEEVVALVARAMGERPAETAKFRSLLRSLRERRPGILGEMALDSWEIRSELRRRGLSLPPGTLYRDVPLMSIGPAIKQAVAQFSRKLGLALYYKHAGRILPSGVALWAPWWSNWTITEDIPRDFAAILRGMPPALKRNNVDLSNQFSYQWIVAPEGQLAAFFAVFRQSFAVGMFVGDDEGRLEAIPASARVRPFHTPSL